MKQFISENEKAPLLLAKELTALVDWSVTELGHVIKDEIGIKEFRRIENIRRYVKSNRTRNQQGLLKLKETLTGLSSTDQFNIAHSFALMLELINSCEAAYRTFRLDQKKITAQPANSRQPIRIIQVLTAHPTESRNPDIIYFFKKIQNLLFERLELIQENQTAELYSLLRMAWNLPMSKQRKPSVMDEAEYIYSLALQTEIIEVFIHNEKLKNPLYIRTWVGGDKDGNPFVDEKAMLGSLTLSRGFLIDWLKKELKVYVEDLLPLIRSGLCDKKKIHKLLLQTRKIKSDLIKLKKIKFNDARHVHSLRSSIELLIKNHQELLGISSESLTKIHFLFKIFPGLAVPLELREDSALVHEALKKPMKAMNISRMLYTLSKLCPDHNPRTYVRGFILSQCESTHDIKAGIQLVQRFCEARLPIVPLFESAHSLKNSPQIIEEFLSSKTNLQIVKKYWYSQLEVMVGYSDSAKENGAFPSRFLIQSALTKLEKKIQGFKLTPIFFHGSGGSIERGGGSVQEQTDWWPLSALNTVKVTVQGEMVYRNYNSALILQRQINLFSEKRHIRQINPPLRDSLHNQALLRELADQVQKSYQKIIAEPQFLELIEKATPYSFLKDLRFGSRPSKRQGTVSLNKLRAIPWVLCWTQTRILFPTWWGIGSFWQNLHRQKRKEYRQLFKESAMFRSYIKALSFTLKKVEMDIFFLYLRSSKLNSTTVELFENLFKKEYASALELVQEITTEKNLLWYRPWLETSIDLRSPLIHPLNILQLIALEKKDIKLLRETVTGIASGMLTTG
ncbi:MAG: phosphoenolpyruvate carboxylase [Pseudobdellovibrionaceae bacterium]